MCECKHLHTGASCNSNNPEDSTHDYIKQVQMQSSVVCQLLQKLVFTFQMMGIPGPGNLRSILCEGTGLDEYVQFSSQAEKEAFQNVSCSLTPQQLINTQQVLLQNLDVRKVLSEVSSPRCPPKSNLSLMNPDES